MNRCTVCCMPDTRPNTEFIDGVCSACISHANRPQIDWDARAFEFTELLDRHDGKCIVPSSGGKDSTSQVIKMLELGADVTIVTAATCYLTDIGRKNIENLSRYARTIQVTPNRTVRAKLNKAGLEMVGDISWPEHCSIFNIPSKVAIDLGISLLIYGECPENQYGGPVGSEEAKTMTRRWVSEFGGFLGLRPVDLIGVDGLTERDMQDYMPPKDSHIQERGLEAHFLGQYFPWDSLKNAEIARDHGFQYRMPCTANWWEVENLDNALHGVHDFFGYLKYGYGRGCSQISVDVRNGRYPREKAMRWIEHSDGLFPWSYADVHLSEVLDHIGLKKSRFFDIADKFKNYALFDGDADHRPILKEFAPCSQSA